MSTSNASPIRSKLPSRRIAAPAYGIRCRDLVEQSRSRTSSALRAVGPPWVAFAAEVADDETARRMATPLDRLDHRFHVVRHSAMLDVVARFGRVDQRIAGSQVERHRIAHAAGV